jgi:3-oxoacyl-[acyl-carrier protein] reductase
MKLDFSNKTALITGATRGIGKAIADKLLKSNASLILTGTKSEEIDKLNEEIANNGITNVKYFQLDLSSEESLKIFLKKIDAFSHIDICINNAGANKISSFLDTSDEDYHLLLDVNLKGPLEILKVVGKKMIENNYGRIVNVASIWSHITKHGRSLYTTSKSGLVGLTKTLSVEWAPYNVLVNAVSPGFTLTELTANTNTPEELKQIEGMIPIKRMAQPFEIANTVLFLCSDLNSYLTGQNIIIDGGYTNV